MKSVSFISSLLLFQYFDCLEIRLTRHENAHYKTNAYVGVVSVGKPGQDFNVEFDLQSSVLWVPDCDFKPYYPEPNAVKELCVNKNTFDTGSSETYSNGTGPIPLDFMCHHVNVYTAYDTFLPGPHYKQPPVVRNFNFAIAYQFPPCYLTVQHDGVFGLSPQSVHGIDVPIRQLLDARVIVEPVVTMFLMMPNKNNMFDGMITLGGLSDLCERPSEYIRVDTEEGWVFPAPTFTIAGLPKRENLGFTATIDQSTDFFYVPLDILKFIVQSAGLYGSDATTGCYVVEGKQFQIAISSIRFSVTLDSSELYDTFPMNPKYKLLRVKETPSTAKTSFVFGTPFFSKHCVVFNYEGRMAFPKKKVF